MTRLLLRSTWLLAALLLGVGCVAPRTHVAQVEAQARPDATAKANYFLVPGGKGQDEAREFGEYTVYVTRALHQQGFRKVATAVEADVLIFMAYGVSDPVTNRYPDVTTTTSGTFVSRGLLPMGSMTPFGGNSGTNISGSTPGFMPPLSNTRSHTSYGRVLNVEAYDMAVYATTKKMELVWKVRVTSVGPEGDLRRVMPFLATAMVPHLGTNSDHRFEVRINEEDPMALAIKNDSATGPNQPKP